MRDVFPGYYQPTPEEYDLLWAEGTFAFDANALLQVYRYTPATRDRLLYVMGRLGDRLWVPHQAAAEYLDQRLNVIPQQQDTYDVLASKVSEQIERARASIRSTPSHAYIDREELIKILDEACERVRVVLSDLKAKHPDRSHSEELHGRITEVFVGKTGFPYSREELAQRHAEADERIKQEVPPGYKDAAKDPPARYGDSIMWFQLLDKARESKKPMVFVTDDRKEDWWIKHRGDYIGPRSELLQEMRAAGVTFYMYQTPEFLEHAEKYLQLQAQPEVIEEIRELRAEDDVQAARVRTIGDLWLSSSYDMVNHAFRDRRTFQWDNEAIDRVMGRQNQVATLLRAMAEDYQENMRRLGLPNPLLLGYPESRAKTLTPEDASTHDGVADDTQETPPNGEDDDQVS